MTDRLRIGTRGSPLARAQADEVITRLRTVDPRLRPEVIVIKTQGDEGYRSDLGTALDGKRAFTKRLEEALLLRRIDVAVHSLKDLPTDTPEGLVLGAIPERADPRDALVTNNGHGLERLSTGLRIGTSSLRRRAQLLAAWPNSEIVDLHGNVGTRLRKIEENELDAVVVAAAGLERLGISRPRIECLEADVMTPAPGQGALAVQARSGDDRVLELLQEIDDRPSRSTVEAERALSARIGGGCNVPLGAIATVSEGTMTLRAMVASPDGRRLLRASAKDRCEDWEAIVDGATRQLLDQGAREILQEGVS